VPVLPNRLYVLRLCCITFSGIIALRDATAAEAEELRAVAPKSVEKNIVRISTKPIFLI